MTVRRTMAAAFLVLVSWQGEALAQYTGAVSRQIEIRPPLPVGSDMDVTSSVAPKSHSQSLPPEVRPESDDPRRGMPRRFQRQLVDFQTSEPAGTIVIDTANTHLYLVLGNGKSMRYGIGVGREGFTWAGTERISRMAEWPDWHPPTEMIDREPHLPRFMAGGAGNPLGARALYLGKTVYRIHGTNQPSTIGTFVSSGCIRLTNEDIVDLYSRVQIGARVLVLPGQPPPTAAIVRFDHREEGRLVPPAELSIAQDGVRASR
jgi:lipoprotein-anchoring transpeptidase ErfK/SrfK